MEGSGSVQEVCMYNMNDKGARGWKKFFVPLFQAALRDRLTLKAFALSYL